MRASLVGTGYVGIVTGACFAHAGHDVIMVDNIKEKVDSINAGRSPIYEKGLGECLPSVYAHLSIPKALPQNKYDVSAAFQNMSPRASPSTS